MGGGNGPGARSIAAPEHENARQRSGRVCYEEAPGRNGRQTLCSRCRTSAGESGERRLLGQEKGREKRKDLEEDR